MLHIGTSGFSYKDWKGIFYPEDIKAQDMLYYYSRYFSTVELDFTYYTMPSAKSIASMERKTPDGFLFAIKAHKSMTHEMDPEASSALKESFDNFLKGILPITESGKLGCILLQFPWGFKHTEGNVRYVERLRELIPGLPLVVEFRNIDWIKDESFKLLRDNGLSFCAVDEPRLKGLVPPVVRITSPISYVRFHGRNAEKWWNHDEPWERYNYLYSDNELLEWLPKIIKIDEHTQRTFVYFNNCHAGHAAKNAVSFLKMIAEKAPALLPKAESPERLFDI